MIRLILTWLFGIVCWLHAQSQANTVGVLLQTSDAFNGYTLLPVTANGDTYLIDNCGEAVHSWTSEYKAGMMAYLREDGSLVRAGRILNSNFQAGGYGGILEIFDWEGNLTWSYTMSNDSLCLHHDIALMPNGHVLALAWKSYEASQWIAQGRDPELTADVVWGTYIVELDPSAPLGEEIVWEWEAFDHLVQSFDSSLPNWGDAASFPTRLDVNYQAGGSDRDWLHTNSIKYNADLDQILISSRDFNEIWIIDHDIPAGSTSETEGDLLYRWGNPEAYGRGTAFDRIFHSQHDARWIDNGQMMVYSNGNERPEGPFSTVEIFTPPLLPGGNYNLTSTEPFGPTGVDRTYPEDLDPDFFSQNTSGSQQLPNGNLLITEGASGEIREVGLDNSIVWSYVNPVGTFGATPQFSLPIANALFKAERYRPDHPALIDKDLQGNGVLELTLDEPVCELYPAPDCTADLDGDLLVGTSDLLIFLSSFGCSSNCTGDFNGNGLVEVGDLLEFLGAIGNACLP